MITLNIDKLTFTLKNDLLPTEIDTLSQQLGHLNKTVGTNNTLFLKAKQYLRENVNNLDTALISTLHIRAFSMLLSEKDFLTYFTFKTHILTSIDKIMNKPSPLILMALEDYFFTYFNDIQEKSKAGLTEWIKNGKIKRKMNKPHDNLLLNINGPENVAKLIMKRQMDLDEISQELELDKHDGSDFVQKIKNIYFLENLKNIPTNQGHPLLKQLQQKAVYNSMYSQDQKLGVPALKILIERADTFQPHEEWRRTIFAIAGDPRVSENHPNYREWWGYIDETLKDKVINWLSELDLTLFLQALKYHTDDDLWDHNSRYEFLNNLLNHKKIVYTRLFVSESFLDELREHYEEQYLASLARLRSGLSFIYVKLSNGSHIVEGINNFALRLYTKIPSNNKIFSYQQDIFESRSLVAGLQQGYYKGILHKGLWQIKAVEALQDMGLDIKAQDLLDPKIYKLYKQKYGMTRR